jgi:heme-degrading monooxygenase HmoA
MEISGIIYAKHNHPRFKAGKREEAKKMLLDFFAENEGKVGGFKGYVLLDSASDPQDEVVITFWASREDMDAFYKSETFSSMVEKGKPYFESPPERKDMVVVDFKIA